jgi:hypothetical protein
MDRCGPPLARASRSACLSLWLFSLTTNQAAAASPTKRPLPAYDGRADQTTIGDVALWVPRIVLSPLYFVSEFVIRRPLGALIGWAERSGAPKAFYDFFTFGPNHTAGFAPLAYLQFGFNPSVGAMVFWNDAGIRGHNLSLQASTWGERWLAATFSERVPITSYAALKYSFTALRRPDYRYHGVGPDTRNADVARFGQDSLHSRLTFEAYPIPARGGRVETFMGQRRVAFYEGSYDQDPGVVAQSQRSNLGLPERFASGFSAIDSGTVVAFDTRPAKDGTIHTGVRFEGNLMHTADLKRSKDRGATAWLTYGGAVGAFLALTGRGRVLSASLATRFADPLGAGAVPFTELVDIGGEGPLRSFAPGRLRGRSFAAATLGYRWPIWINLDGAIDVSVGNVFDEHLKGLSADKLRLSTAIGIETSGKPDNAFQMLLGIGTDTFERGVRADSVRLVIGTHRGL